MRLTPALVIAGWLLSAGVAKRSEAMVSAQTPPTPVRAALEQMTTSEKRNSRISVEFMSIDGDAIALGHDVERLWNSGRYDEALMQFDRLEARVGCVAIGNSWRKPVRTLATFLWGGDVRIGNRDSLLGISFDIQHSSGNLFAVLRRAGTPHYSVCMSTDGGMTWGETFTWSGSPPPSLDAAVLVNHLYVAYSSPGDNAQQVRLRRFLCSNGMVDTFPGLDWVAACTLDMGDTMKEVSIVSNQYSSSNRLYITTLVSDGSMISSYDDANATSWTTLSTGITSGARNGLDATENQHSDSTYHFFSYYDVTDTLRVYGPAGDGFGLRFSHFAGAGTRTSISASYSTIICAYEDETSSPSQVRCVTSYDGGDTWTTGILSNVDTAAEAPAVTAHGGGGLAAVFRHNSPTPELRFRQRAYSEPWGDQVTIADHEPYWGRPAVEFLSSGVFGVAYLSNTNPVVRGAYFDRSDWVYGIAEQPLDAGEGMLSVTPNPLKGHGRLSCTLSHPADLRVHMYDHAGRLVRALFEGHSPAGRQTVAFAVSDVVPGVYFLRLDTPGLRAVKKAVVTR